MKSLGQLLQVYIDKHHLDELEGIAPTAIRGVTVYRSSTGNKRTPFVYQSGIIILGQGCKNIHIGNVPVCYGPEDYLVVGVPMPLECEAHAVDGKPLLGLNIDIDPKLLHRMVNKLEAIGYRHSPRTGHKQRPGLRSVHMNDRMLSSCKRLVEALCDDLEAEMLGEILLEEMVFRALTSEEGYVLFDLAQHEGAYARVAKALNKVHKDYSSTLTVQALAEEASMSISAFHTAFRSVTLESPLQYIKKVRLNKARELIHFEGRRVNDAARLVGYTSSSQFSREYKRHFNETPSGVRAN